MALPEGMSTPDGVLLEEARGMLQRLGLEESPELLALWFAGWTSGYTTGFADQAEMDQRFEQRLDELRERRRRTD